MQFLTVYLKDELQYNCTTREDTDAAGDAYFSSGPFLLSRLALRISIPFGKSKRKYYEREL
jgi:hypothetical protein